MKRDDYQPKHLHKQTPGWLFPYLVQIDALPGIGTGRWEYWSNTILDMHLPDAPIPQIDFANQPPADVCKHIADVLKSAERHAGMRHSETFEAFVVWLLHGLGLPSLREHDNPLAIPDCRRLTARVLDEWYEQFNLGLMIQKPADYMAHFSQGGANGDFNPYTGAGFFATPMSVCKMMADLQFAGDHGDHRAQTFVDPCSGTGSLLLAASNYTMRLHAQDISRHMVNCVMVNAYLYMPWLVWWPDFSRYGGPTKQQLEHAIWGDHEQTYTIDANGAESAPQRPAEDVSETDHHEPDTAPVSEPDVQPGETPAVMPGQEPTEAPCPNDESVKLVQLKLF